MPTARAEGDSYVEGTSICRFTEDQIRRILSMVDKYRNEHPEANMTATTRVGAILDMRATDRQSEWVFPSATRSGILNREA